MAVLNRTQYMAHIQTLVGENLDDNTLKIMEDLTDTFDSRENGENENWKEKYENLDNEWKKRYKERFFSGKPEKERQPDADQEKEEYDIEDDWKINPKTEYDIFYRTE